MEMEETKEMKTKQLIVAGIVALFATSANAETVTGTVQEHYKWVVNQTPYRVEVCKDVRVRGQASTGDTIVGAIIGGAIGNQFGGGKGKDAATILGAIVGADVANKNSSTLGSTRRECQVETRYEESREEVYSHSTIQFFLNGREHRLRFKK